nr:unnamed protein product [Callosobruchus analis]
MDTSGYPKHDNLKTFRTSLAFALIKGQKPTRRMSKPANEVPTKKIRVPVGIRPPPDVRYNQIGHFPNFREKGRQYTALHPRQHGPSLKAAH